MNLDTAKGLRDCIGAFGYGYAAGKFLEIIKARDEAQNLIDRLMQSEPGSTEDSVAQAAMEKYYEARHKDNVKAV